MVDVPKDIQRAAYDAALAYRHEIATNPRLKEGPVDPIHNDDVLIAHIAAALLSERERRTAQGVTDKTAEAFDLVSEWHDKQARQFREMASDVRIGQLDAAKAKEAARHHAGSAAALRLKAIKVRQDAAPSLSTSAGGE